MISNSTSTSTGTVAAFVYSVREALSMLQQGHADKCRQVLDVALKTYASECEIEAAVAYGVGVGSGAAPMPEMVFGCNSLGVLTLRRHGDVQPSM